MHCLQGWWEFAKVRVAHRSSSCGLDRVCAFIAATPQKTEVAPPLCANSNSSIHFSGPRRFLAGDDLGAPTHTLTAGLFQYTALPLSISMFFSVIFHPSPLLSAVLMLNHAAEAILCHSTMWGSLLYFVRKFLSFFVSFILFFLNTTIYQWQANVKNLYCEHPAGRDVSKVRIFPSFSPEATFCNLFSLHLGLAAEDKGATSAKL